VSTDFPRGAPRILAVTGTQLPFPRLLSALDNWAALHPDAAVLAQAGKDVESYPNIRTVPFISQHEFARRLAEADAVVAHAGMGTILACSEMFKPLVVMPRKASLGEHRNDHQADTAAHMKRLSNLTVALDGAALSDALDLALGMSIGNLGERDPSDAAKDLIGAVKSFVWNEETKVSPSSAARVQI
jgi:UDP-N-acetylglucosamine transferase subunit ALG13